MVVELAAASVVAALENVVTGPSKAGHGARITSENVIEKSTADRVAARQPVIAADGMAGQSEGVTRGLVGRLVAYARQGIKRPVDRWQHRDVIATVSRTGHVA